MTYPPPPGQYPGSGGFPQQPGQYPPPPSMPQYPGGIDGPRQLEPHGGVAVAAGVLGILGALFGVIFALLNFDSIQVLQGSRLEWVIWLQAFAYTIEVITLGPGSILIFVRRTAGRWLVMTGCVVQLAQAITALVAVLAMGVQLSNQESGAVAVGSTTGGLLIVLTPAIATLILTALPVTGRWLSWKRRAPETPLYGPPPGAPGYGPPPGYGQAPGPGPGYGPPPGYPPQS
jgi:hypothetical protein